MPRHGNGPRRLRRLRVLAAAAVGQVEEQGGDAGDDEAAAEEEVRVRGCPAQVEQVPGEDGRGDRDRTTKTDHEPDRGAANRRRVDRRADRVEAGDAAVGEEAYKDGQEQREA